jgi:proteasome assembly chaperone (PAC2) family protein
MEMNDLYLRYLSRPKLEEPVFVGGFQGFGNVGSVTAHLLIEFSRAEPFAELYSPSFPDYVTVNKNGICRVPHYDFYGSSTGKPHFIILTGDAYTSSEDIVAHYKLCDKFLDFITDFRCKFIVTLDGVPTPSPSREVYVAATSSKLAVEVMEKVAILYAGRILGISGLLLGSAKNRGLEGICLLGATSNLEGDKKVAFSVFKFLTKVLKMEEMRNSS